MKLKTFFVSLLLPVAIVELICLSPLTQIDLKLTDKNTQEQCKPEDCVPPNSTQEQCTSQDCVPPNSSNRS